MKLDTNVVRALPDTLVLRWRWVADGHHAGAWVGRVKLVCCHICCCFFTRGHVWRRGPWLHYICEDCHAELLKRQEAETWARSVHRRD